MTRPRTARRRRAAGDKPKARWVPTKAKCHGCGETRYIDPESGLCQKCEEKQEALL